MHPGLTHRFLSAIWWPPLCHQNEFKLRCWFVNFDEPDSWQPGPFEKAKVEHESYVNDNMRTRDRCVGHKRVADACTQQYSSRCTVAAVRYTTPTTLCLCT